MYRQDRDSSMSNFGTKAHSCLQIYRMNVSDSFLEDSSRTCFLLRSVSTVIIATSTCRFVKEPSHFARQRTTAVKLGRDQRACLKCSSSDRHQVTYASFGRRCAIPIESKLDETVCTPLCWNELIEMGFHVVRIDFVDCQTDMALYWRDFTLRLGSRLWYERPAGRGARGNAPGS
jgi:hypothetical protein